MSILNQKARVIKMRLKIKFENVEVSEREYYIGMWFCAVGIAIGVGIFLWLRLFGLW